MACIPRVYEEVINFLATGPSSQEIIDYRPSQEASDRLEDLIRREKNEGLNAEETKELDYFMQLEHIMRMAKARARQLS